MVIDLSAKERTSRDSKMFNKQCSLKTPPRPRQQYHRTNEPALANHCRLLTKTHFFAHIHSRPPARPPLLPSTCKLSARSRRSQLHAEYKSAENQAAWNEVDRREKVLCKKNVFVSTRSRFTPSLSPPNSIVLLHLM